MAAAGGQAQVQAGQGQAGQAQAGGGGAPAPVVAAGGGAAAATILFSPWQGDIDLNTKQGKALWDEGIRPLETKFTGYAKDLVRFLACVQNQVAKCQWNAIIIIAGKNLLKSYGEITRDQVTAARDVRNAIVITTLAEARPRMNSLMMFHFIYNSLDSMPQKKLSTRLENIQQDGPLLLKLVLDDTFIATTASTFLIKEKFYDLHLKKYRWNVLSLNQDIREKMVDLVAAGHKADETDMIIALF